MAIATFRLPDGRLADFNIPDGINEQQAQDLVNSYIASNPDALKAAEAPSTQLTTQPIAGTPAPEDTRDYAGFFGAMGEAATTLGLQDEFNAYMANPTKENRDKFVAAGESKYKPAEFGGDKSLNENWEALKQLAGSSLGFLAPAWGAGKVGAIAGAKAAPGLYKPVGAAVGAGAGMYGTLADEYAIQTALRKAQEQAAQEAAGEEVTPLSRARIFTAAAGETALDALGFTFFKGLGKMMPGEAGKVVTKLSEEEGSQVIADAIKNGTYSVANGIVKGVARGVAFEAPQEALQSAFERFGADLPVSPFDPQAFEEYKQSMLGGALLGGPMGAVDTGLKVRAARQVIREEKAAEEAKLKEQEEPEKTTEQKIKDTVDRLVKRGIPENTAIEIATEQHTSGVEDESARTATGVKDYGVDDTGAGASIQIPGEEGTEEGFTGETEGTTRGGVGVSGGDLESTGGTEGRESGALNIPPWMMRDAQQAEQEFGPGEESDQEVTIQTLTLSLPDGQVADFEVPAGLTREQAQDAVDQQFAEMTQEEFDDLMKRTTVPQEQAPKAIPVSPAPKVAPVDEAAPTQEGLFTAQDTAQGDKQIRENTFAKLAEEKRKTAGLRKKLNDSIRFLASQGQMRVEQANELILELQRQTPNFTKINKAISDAQETAAEAELGPEEGTSIDEELAAQDNINRFGQEQTAAYEGEDTQELTGRDLRWRQGEEGAAGVNAEDAQNTINSTLAGWTNAPTVVIGKAPDSTTKAQYDPETRTVNVFPENHQSPSDITATIHHESLGHHGLSEKYNTELENVMSDIYRTNTAVRAEADIWLKDNPDADGAKNKQARAAEEVLARRSESGPIKHPGIRAAFGKVVAFTRDFLRKNLGVVKTYTDNDVAHILRQAHERVRKGKPSKQAAPKGKRFSKMRNQEKSIEEAEHKYQASLKDQDTLLSSLIDLLKGRTESAKDELDALADAGTTRTVETLFPQRTGTAIREWAIRKLPALKDTLESANDLNNEFLASISRFTRSFSETSRKVERFINKNGKRELARLITFARLHAVNAASWVKNKTTYEDALRTDSIWSQYNDKYLDASSSFATAEEKAKEKYFKRKLDERAKQISQVYGAWNSLGLQEGGHTTYKEIMEFFKDMYLITRKLLDQDIDRLNISAEDKAKIKQLAKQSDEEEVDDDGIVHKSFVESYFPWKRFGDRWLAVKNGPYGREFYTDFSATKINKKEQRLRKKYGNKATFEKGKSLDELRKKYASDLPLLNDIIDILNRAKVAGETDMGTVKDDIVQLWLSTLGERNLRKKMLHSEDISGFDSDILSVLNDAMGGLSRQIPKLMYGNRIRNEYDTAIELIKGATEEGIIDSTLGSKLKTVVGILKGRAELDLNPRKVGKIAKLGRGFGRFNYVIFMSGVATAALQSVNIVSRVIPKAFRYYGPIKTGKLITKYLNVYKSIGAVRRQEDNTIIIPGEEEFSWDEPSIGVGSSSLIKNNPVLQKLFEIGRNHDVFSGVRTSAIDTISATSTKFSRSMENAEKMFTMLYNASDRINREITYMVFAELEYNRLMKDEKWKREQKANGLNVREEAIKAAGKQAVQYTGDTQGRYTTSERPNAFQNEFLKSSGLTQFKMWAVNQWQWQLKAARELAQGDTGALYELAGAYITIGLLLGGLSRLPFYSIITGLIDLLGLLDEDDPEDKDYNATFLGSDADGYFRYRWLPKHFGAYKVDVGDKEYSMSSILDRGVFPVLTGIDTGPRVSLDSLWWREPLYASTIGGKILSAAGANAGPTISNGMNYTNAAQALQDGDLMEAVKKMAPAPAKAAITANELGEKGAVTAAGNKLIQGSISSLAEVGVLAGFQATEIADAKDRINRWYRGAAKYDAEKADFLNLYNKLRYEKGTDKDLARLKDMYKTFNTKYPLLPIDDDTLERSANAYDKKKQGAVFGVSMTPEELAMNTWFLEGRPITKPPKK